MDFPGVQAGAQPGHRLGAVEVFDPGPPEEVVDDAGMLPQSVVHPCPVPRFEIDPPGAKNLSLLSDLVFTQRGGNAFAHAEDELFRPIDPFPCQELGHGSGDFGWPELPLVLALVDDVFIGELTSAVEVDAVLVVPLGSIAAALLDLGFLAGQAQAQPLEVTPVQFLIG
jgi:hypothetical protein